MRASPCVSSRRCRALRWRSRRHHGLRLRQVLHRVQPRSLRTAHPGRAAGRPTVVPPPPGGRAVLEDPRPARGLLGQARTTRPLSCGWVGASQRGRHDAPRRTCLEEAMIVDLPRTTTAAVNKKMVELRNDVGAMTLGRVLTLVIVVDGTEVDEAIDAANDASRQHPCRIIV